MAVKIVHGDDAIVVVVRFLVEGEDLAVFLAVGTDVVRDDVEHDVDSGLVAGVDELDEILFGAEVLVQLVEAPVPVAVVAAVEVVLDRNSARWRRSPCP